MANSGNDACQELNVTAQRWLEALLLPTEGGDPPHPPSSDPLGSQDLNGVLENLKQLMKLEEVPKTSLRAGGTHLAVLGRSLSSYLHVALDSRDSERVARSVTEQTTKWLSTIFKFEQQGLTPYYHDDLRDGLVRVLQMSLCRKYDKFVLEGLGALYLKPPVVYISDAGQSVECLHMCTKLGLPMSCITFISCNTAFGSTHSIDVIALDKQINDDITEGKVPLMVIAYAGTPLAGHVENLIRLREICTQHGLWLHVQGHALSSLCLPSVETEVTTAKEADSFTLCPGTWFGLLSCPFLTLHKAPLVIDTEGAIPDATNFPPKSMDIPSGSIPIPQVYWNALQAKGINRLLPLTLWLSVQYLGANTLVDTVNYCSNLLQHMIHKLSEVLGVEQIDVPNHKSYMVLFKYVGGGEVEGIDMASFAPPTTPTEEQEEGKTAGTPEQGEARQLEAGLGAEPAEGEGKDVEESRTEEEEDCPLPRTIVEPLPPTTANVFNLMIAKELVQQLPKVGVVMLKLPHSGVCFKFDPVNSFPEHSTSLEDIDKFIAALQMKVRLLHPTALARCLLEGVLTGQPNLRCLEFPSYYGAGFIQYVPTDWANKMELSLEEVNHLNKLNLELSRSLTQRSPIYSPFQHGNFTCIMIKELPENVTVPHFIDELLAVTKKFEEEREFIEGMSEKIRKGIEAAETDLSKEKEKLTQEEGFLKYIPVVGSMLSWFAPSTPTTPEGRTFSLASGKVDSTSDTYKFKMQLLTDSPDDEAKDGKTAVASLLGFAAAEQSASGSEQDTSANDMTTQTLDEDDASREEQPGEVDGAGEAAAS